MEEIDWSSRKNQDTATLLDYIGAWKALTPDEQKTYGSFANYIRALEDRRA